MGKGGKANGLEARVVSLGRNRFHRSAAAAIGEVGRLASSVVQPAERRSNA